MATRIILIQITTILFATSVSGIFITGSPPSHVRYPPVNFCLHNNAENASVSFEFKTSQSREAILYYAQNKEGGFILINYVSSGHLHASIQQGDVVCRLRSGPFKVTDGRWKSLTLGKVEQVVTLKFGEVERSVEIDKCVKNLQYKPPPNYPDNNYINNNKDGDEDMKSSFSFIGGIPLLFKRSLHKLHQPYVAELRPFNGYLKNVFYRNCSCQATRVMPISGQGFEVFPAEVCDLNRKLCAKGCLCRTVEYSGHQCDCSETYCVES